MGDDRCIVCGCYVPEGRMVCPVCSGEVEERERGQQMLSALLNVSRIKNKENGGEEHQ